MDYIYKILFKEIQTIESSIQSKIIARDNLFARYNDVIAEIAQLEIVYEELAKELRKREIISNDHESMSKHDFDDFINNLIEGYEDEI